MSSRTRRSELVWLAVILALSTPAPGEEEQESGRIYVIAGAPDREDFFGNGIPATEAGLGWPSDVFVDAAGAMIVPGNRRLRWIDPNGVVFSIGASREPDSPPGPGSHPLPLPNAIGYTHSPFVDDSGTLYMAGGGDWRTDSPGIVRIDSSGLTKIPDVDGVSHLFVDEHGVLYFSRPFDHQIRMIDTDGHIRDVAGTGKAGFSGDGGLATAAQLNRPYSPFKDRSGSLYFADWGNSRIRRIDASGIVTTVAGDGTVGVSGDGGPAVQASLNHPQDVFVDSEQNIFIAETGSDRVRKIDRSGIISTIAGGGSLTGYHGARATDARLSDPEGLFVTREGDLLIADGGNHVIAKVVGVAAPTSLSEGIFTVTDETIDVDPPTMVEHSVHPDSLVDPYSTQFTITFDEIVDYGEVETQFRTGNEIEPGRRTSFGKRNWSRDDRTLTISHLGNLQYGRDYILHISRVRDVHANQAADILLPFRTISDESLPPGTAVTVVDARYVSSLTTDDAGNLFYVDAWAGGVWRVDPNGVGTRVGAIQNLEDRVNPSDVFLSPDGTLFIAEYSASAVYAIPGGAVAGKDPRPDPSGYYWGVSGFDGDGREATDCMIDRPTGVFVDPDGNLYIADTGNHRIRRVDGGTGVVSTIAGNGRSGYSGDGGPATSARLHSPVDVCVSSEGDLYIVDLNNHRVRKVQSGTGLITTVAGDGWPRYAGDDGPADQASLFSPTDVEIDGDGCLYIADWANHRIRKVDGSGVISTLAGGFNGPFAIAIDVQGNLFVADAKNQRIRKIVHVARPAGYPQGVYEVPGVVPEPPAEDILLPGSMHIVVGFDAEGSYDGDGGDGMSGRLNGATNTAIDRDGNLYIADSGNHRILRVDPSGTICTLVGGDSDMSAARLSSPRDVAVDLDGQLIIADIGNHRIVKFDPASGEMRTIAGNGKKGFSGDGGLATEASLDSPRGLAVDRMGNVLIADTRNLCIRMIAVDTGRISTVAGFDDDGPQRLGGDGGPAGEARLDSPENLCIDRMGNYFIADTGNHRVRRIDARTGIIETVVGSSRGYTGVGGPAIDAKLGGPHGVFVDDGGNLFIADAPNHRVLMVDSDGIVALIAQRGVPYWALDGTPYMTSSVNSPKGVLVDEKGDLYITAANVLRIVGRGVPTTVPIASAVEEPIATLPQAASLAQNYPNPFNPSTVVGFQLPTPAQVELAIYNLLGQRVVTLVDEVREAGAHAAQWNGRDEAGSELASGVYVCRFRAGSHQQTRRLVLLR